ncbi:MAG: hypothetical protein GY865_03270 [candidate division Zixibacteria bacterium]|nr:hypothetical protein [candidate division Zixibacteria bacterium]
MRYSREIIILILLLIPLCSSHAEEIAQSKYGAFAGSIAGHYDSIGVIATVYMKKSDASRSLRLKQNQWADTTILKIQIERFNGHQFIIDSLPTGEYDLMIMGETFNSSYKSLGYGKCCCDYATIRIAHDSITIFKVNIFPENRSGIIIDSRVGCFFRTDSIISDNYSQIKYEIEKRGFEKELMTLCFRCETYTGRLTRSLGNREQYTPTDTVFGKPLRIMPAFITDGSLSLDLMSDKIYSKNGFKIHYKETRDNNNIFISISDHAPESDVYNPDWRRPATGSHLLKFSEGKYNLFFIANDTSVYSIDVEQKRVDIKLIDSGSVSISTNPIIWKETF